MWWLQDIIVPLVLVVGVGCFVVLVRFRTRMMTRETSRTAESMYPQYADSARRQRKYAREHGGLWEDDESSRDG